VIEPDSTLLKSLKALKGFMQQALSIEISNLKTFSLEVMDISSSLISAYPRNSQDGTGTPFQRAVYVTGVVMVTMEESFILLFLGRLSLLRLLG
jgi:hypothetical protein